MNNAGGHGADDLSLCPSAIAHRDELYMPEVSNMAIGSNTPGDDRALLSPIKSGSESAIDGLIERYQPEIYTLALYVLNDPEAAIDVTITIFAKSSIGIGDLPLGASRRIWLYRISIREILARRPGRAALPPDCDGGTGPGGQSDPALAFPPKDSLPGSDRQTAIRHALGNLPKHLRAVLILRDFVGLSYEEVAEVLNVPMHSVKNRVSQGRRALLDLLQPVVPQLEKSETIEPARRANLESFRAVIGLLISRISLFGGETSR